MIDVILTQNFESIINLVSQFGYSLFLTYKNRKKVKIFIYDSKNRFSNSVL